MERSQRLLVVTGDDVLGCGEGEGESTQATIVFGQTVVNTQERQYNLGFESYGRTCREVYNRDEHTSSSPLSNQLSTFTSISIVPSTCLFPRPFNERRYLNKKLKVSTQCMRYEAEKAEDTATNTASAHL